MRHRLVGLGLALLPHGVAAQGPLTIEQLLVDASRWQLVSGYEFRSATTGPGTTVESTAWSTALRYGVSNRLELSATLAVDAFNIDSGSNASGQRLETLSVGGNWLVHDESTFPALLVELNGDFGTDSDDGGEGLTATRWAVTTYRTLDPLVLSLTVAMRRERARDFNGVGVQAGDSYLANARVNFAVNPRVTLFGGITYQAHAATRVDGQALPSPPDSVGVNGGVAFAAASRHTVFLDADVAPQASASGVSLRWFMEF